MKVGKLKGEPVVDNLDLVAGSVAKILKSSSLPTESIYVVKIDPQFADTAGFCEQYEVGLDQSVNCVVLEARKSDKRWFAACMVVATHRADINGKIRKALGARSVSFASMEKALKETGMEYGGITPIGLPDNWTIVVDGDALKQDYVIVGSGIRDSKLLIPGSLLAKLPNSIIIEKITKD